MNLQKFFKILSGNFLVFYNKKLITLFLKIEFFFEEWEISLCLYAVVFKGVKNVKYNTTIFLLQCNYNDREFATGNHPTN